MNHVDPPQYAVVGGMIQQETDIQLVSAGDSPGGSVDWRGEGDSGGPKEIPGLTKRHHGSPAPSYAGEGKSPNKRRPVRRNDVVVVYRDPVRNDQQGFRVRVDGVRNDGTLVGTVVGFDSFYPTRQIAGIKAGDCVRIRSMALVHHVQLA
jgi:hypothetical protein